MKKAIGILLLVLLLFSLCACSGGGKTPDPSASPKADEDVAENRCPCAVMLEGEQYLCFFDKSEVIPNDSQITGTIKSDVVETSMPSENEQCNFPAGVDQPYAIIDGTVYLCIDDVWYVCIPNGEQD